MKKGLLLVLGTALISGLAIFLNKFALAKINPFLFTTCKNYLVMLFLFAILFFRREFYRFKKLSRIDWIKLILIGIVGGSIPFLLFFYGLKLTLATKAAFIHKTLFLWVSVLAFIFLKEKLTKKQIVAAAMLLVGAFLIILPSFEKITLGDVLVFLATLFWSAEQILAKSVLKVKNVSGTMVAFCRMFFGLFVMVPFVIYTGTIKELLSFGFNQFAWILFTSILLLGYVLTWYNGIKYIEISKATAVLLLGSVFTTILNMLYKATLLENALIGIIIVLPALFVFILENPQIMFSKNFFSSK